EPEPVSILLEALNLRREVDQGKVILNSVTLVVRPQEFVAVVGVSGAGKSTLLGALSGFRPATSGQVLLNGISLYDHFETLRSKIGYVPQDDIIHRELPVERALEYAAELRLPAELTHAQRLARVSEVLAELGLEQHRQTLVSSLSGGQRKRVSIGVELLTSPPLFFLDEPTSGLDPGTETRMMALLRQLADQGRTVLLITHATRNVSMCDRVLFLARGGRVAFYGAPKVALDYFGVREFEDIYDLIENTRTPEEWEQSFAASPLYQSEIVERIEHPAGSRLVAPAPKPQAAYGPGQPRPPSESVRQFKILTRRYAEIVLRDRKNLAILLLQAPVLAILLWAVFKSPNIFQPPPNPFVVIPGQGAAPVTPELTKDLTQFLKQNGKAGANGGDADVAIIVYDGPDCSDRGRGPNCHQDQALGNGNAGKAAQICSILALVAVWLGTLNAVREISKEDAIYRRERLVNLRVFPYIASKFAVLLALVLVQATLLFFVTAIRIHFPAGGLIPVWISLLLGGAASVAVALAVSAAVSNPDRAVFAAPMILVPQIFFAGLFVQVKDLGPAQVLAALVSARWTFEGVGRAANVIGAAAVPPLWPSRDAMDGEYISRWLILLGFVVAFGALAAVLQRTKDRR
ncbi:MAG TPA: ATP-binding cassette domain-containing protein, partial [Dehalococcoidia bacterium]|nr:ATP-binding cassette domain-containing protein [Dehalococcoidia bacterium]